jgi:hypothetical protein
VSWTDPRIARRKERNDQVRVAGIFGETFYDSAGETHSYAALAPVAAEIQPQLELKLAGYSKNHVIRQRLAEKISGAVDRLYQRTGTADLYVAELAAKLRNARLDGTCGLRMNNGKPIFYWDTKAGLSRFCPDDAREDAMRLQRKVLDPVAELQAGGASIHYAVFTTPNAPAGELRKEMAAIQGRLRKFLKGFPQIIGALTVLEAPLGESRDWNVHVNALLVVRGFLDYGELRRKWHWNCHMEKLATGPDAIRSALAELIKYAVAATVSKSAEKAAPAGHSRAPPMLEWRDSELFEFIYAMRGFRRTRSYGCLYKLGKPEPEEIGQVIHIGTVKAWRGAIVFRSALLESIPGDNFLGLTGAERWIALKKALQVADLEGAEDIGARLPARFEAAA